MASSNGGELARDKLPLLTVSPLEARENPMVQGVEHPREKLDFGLFVNTSKAWIILEIMVQEKVVWICNSS